MGYSEYSQWYSEYSHGVFGVLTVGLPSGHAPSLTQPGERRKVSLDTFNVEGAKGKPQTKAGGRACLH
jgi:hypothetical protein